MHLQHIYSSRDQLNISKAGIPCSVLPNIIMYSLLFENFTFSQLFNNCNSKIFEVLNESNSQRWTVAVNGPLFSHEAISFRHEESEKHYTSPLWEL